MKFNVNGQIKEVTLKEWQGDGYSPDFFGDMEVNFPATHEVEEGGSTIICTEEEFSELVEWWEDEVKAYNKGKDTEALGQISDTEKEYMLSVD